MTKFCHKRAQTTVEYTMILICIFAALLCMQHYIKRAAQGRLRDSADLIGGQYDSKNIGSNITSSTFSTTVIDSQYVREENAEAEDGFIDGIKTTVETANEITRKTGHETLKKFPNDLYD